MTPEEKESLLDRYVTGYPMSTDEEMVVQQLLRTDRSFREEYSLRQTLLEAGIQQRRAAWASRQRNRVVTDRQTAFPMSWVAAASVLLLLGIGLIWRPWQPGSGDPTNGDATLYRLGNNQLGLAGNDTLAVGTIHWEIIQAPENSYDFSQLDTLRIFAVDPDQWKKYPLRLTSLSEIRYQLEVGNRTYMLEQGRSIRLPLTPVR
ncbi:hypothetical protein [Spirosoma sordidisoli]|uniref:Uncharacterized protein n=1 Tax=Spirosoma sordidisoli TaxID=2502893 RepID=A0A4Q2UQX0_9BACT|nr:hypothetical protein [Spirosoma sordidisoli]RYC70050.1 hypothetical protein EQG79_09270 [Spirosoma sordidisoli]